MKKLVFMFVALVAMFACGGNSTKSVDVSDSTNVDSIEVVDSINVIDSTAIDTSSIN